MMPRQLEFAHIALVDLFERGVLHGIGRAAVVGPVLSAGANHTGKRADREAEATATPRRPQCLCYSAQWFKAASGC